MKSFDELTSAEFAAWHRLRNANPALDSPYFHPGFSAAVHASGRPVHVAVLREGGGEKGEVVALWPVHRDRAVLRPVGWPGADFQGPILAPGTELDPMDLLAGGAKALEFDHLLDGLPGFDPWVTSRRPSPYIDTTGGLDGYAARASRSGKDNMSQARRRTAKAGREIGEVVFQADVVDHKALAEVIRLKRDQYAATGARDYFADQDRVDLMTALLDTRGTDFGGILSTVYAGDTLLAAHFGIRSGGVLHWWFPVYDPGHSSLAPGWILLRELVQAAPALGVTRIDLGRGEDEYKRRAKTGEVDVCQGMVARGSARLALRNARTSAIATVKGSPLAPVARGIVRTLRK